MERDFYESTWNITCKYAWELFWGYEMTYFDQMVYDGKFKEVEELIVERIISLDDLSELAFLIFKTWAEG